MKKIFKKILQYYLKYLAKLILFIYRPTIIAIAGSVNKAFVKNEVKQLLEKNNIEVRANPKSFNTEIGLPLAILNLPSGYNSYSAWLPVIFKSFSCLWQKNFPQLLILELGTSDPGDMKYLLSIVRPKISVITDVTQRYLESFEDVNELLGEYKTLVKKTNKNGLVLLNCDNEKIKNISKFAKTRVEYFGFGNEALWQALDIKPDKNGQIVRVKHNNNITQHDIKKFGQHHVYSLLISLAIEDYVKRTKKK